MQRRQKTLSRGKDLTDLGSGTQMVDVVEFSVYLSADVDTLSAVVEGIAEESGEEDSKECRREDKSLLSPLLSGKKLDVLPLWQTVLCISSWKDLNIWSNILGGRQPTFSSRRLKSSFRLTKSKTFVSLIKAIYNNFCCSQHFSCS